MSAEAAAATSKESGAVMQMEIDLLRWTKTESFDASCYGEDPWKRLYAIAKTAVGDTLHKGGSLVVIRDGNIVTIVQRPAEAD